MKASEELLSYDHQNKTNEVIVLLTDGVPNRPTKLDDKKYPEDLASSTAETVKKRGIQIYTIALGKDIHTDFLKGIASGPDHYFAAPSGKDLKDIYVNIASAICKKGPAVIEIIPRIMPSQP